MSIKFAEHRIIVYDFPCCIPYFSMEMISIRFIFRSIIFAPQINIEDKFNIICICTGHILMNLQAAFCRCIIESYT